MSGLRILDFFTRHPALLVVVVFGPFAVLVVGLAVLS